MYKPLDIDKFASHLITKLRDIVEFKHIGDLDDENY